MSNINEKDDTATMDGPKNLSSDDYETITIPEPKEKNGKFQCTICNRFFYSKEGYYTHARQKHKVGSAISTAIY